MVGRNCCGIQEGNCQAANDCFSPLAGKWLVETIVPIFCCSSCESFSPLAGKWLVETEHQPAITPVCLKFQSPCGEMVGRNCSVLKLKQSKLPGKGFREPKILVIFSRPYCKLFATSLIYQTLELFTCQGSGDFREPLGIFALTSVREKCG